MASQILGRRATGAEDFAEAFNLEWVVPWGSDVSRSGRH